MLWLVGVYGGSIVQFPELSSPLTITLYCHHVGWGAMNIQKDVYSP